jgi:hypothetical protein
LPEVEHQFCVIYITNLIWEAFDTKLTATFAGWRKAFPFVKIWRGTHIVAALEGAGAVKTVVRLGPDARWH